MNYDYIKNLYGINKRDVKISEDLIEAVEDNFVVFDGKMDREAAIQLIAKNPHLLNHTGASLQERFDLFEEFGWTNKYDLTAALKKNKNIFSMNKNDLVKKVYVFNGLGFSSSYLIKHPILLSCPLKDIKLKFMLGSFEVYNLRKPSFFVQSLKKSYSRICYLSSINESVLNNLTLSSRQFKRKFEVSDAEIQEMFQLSSDAINAIERNYNFLRENNPKLPAVSLTRKEKQESLTRINIKELKEKFFNEMRKNNDKGLEY